MKGTGKHHFLWTASSYETEMEQRLRSHQGMGGRIPNALHRELHTVFDAPPKPELGRIIGGVALLDGKSLSFLSQPGEVLQMMAQFFGTEGDEAVGNHLFAQYDFLKGAL